MRKAWCTQTLWWGQTPTPPWSTASASWDGVGYGLYIMLMFPDQLSGCYGSLFRQLTTVSFLINTRMFLNVQSSTTNGSIRIETLKSKNKSSLQHMLIMYKSWLFIMNSYNSLHTIINTTIHYKYKIIYKTCVNC